MARRLQDLEAICVRQDDWLSQKQCAHEPDRRRLSDAATVLLFALRRIERLTTQHQLYRTPEEQAEIEHALAEVEPWLLWLQGEGKSAPIPTVVERLLWMNQRALCALRVIINAQQRRGR